MHSSFIFFNFKEYPVLCGYVYDEKISVFWLALYLHWIIIFFAANFAQSGNMASNFPSKNINLAK